MIIPKQAQEIIRVLDEIRASCFKQGNTESLYPFAQWEQKREQVKQRLRNLPDYIEQAADLILFNRPKVGHPKRLNVIKRTTLFLFTRLMCKSNRDVENLLVLCKPLFGFQASYKYIERLYSDDEVNLVLHNLFLLLLQDEGVSGDFSGDGTGYSLSVTKHYRTDDSKKGHMYVFRVIDIDTGFYVACGYSTRSEMDAFNKAMHMLTEFDIPVDSMSLDKYYSSRKVIRIFDKETMLYLIPKKNLATIGVVWAPILRRIQEDPYLFLKGYYLRNLSESGFSADKRRFGSIVRQKRDDRRETALFSTAFLHNIFTVRIRPE